ncbi:MAG: 7-carboxy-7-deazaguanine synthase QueE [Candidatus Binatia bacterium]|nr:7-carboxy-7-deazaguanine synthase QueE [Candidatus Binatia bacterium]
MFGKNKIEKAVWDNPRASEAEKKGEVLAVNSIWYTIQGEGPHAGEPAVFIRLAGCNLRCHFCDTEFEKREWMLMEAVVRKVIELASDVTDLVVLTGGEPLRQQITPLCHELAFQGYTTQIETAGTVWPPTPKDGLRSLDAMIRGCDVELVCSPKTGKIHPEVERACRHFKYIVRVGSVSDTDGLPVASTQNPAARLQLYRPNDPAVIIWVQPCDVYDENGHRSGRAYQANMELATSLALRYGYRVSVQLHKLLGVE